MKKDNPRCQALDMEGKECRKKSVTSYQYHGDGELYNSLNDDKKPQWIKAHLCEDHRV